MIKRTYVDSNVIISAFQSKTASAILALSVLDDLKREFITSAFVRLETLPKPRVHGFLEEVRFIENFFDRCVDQITVDDLLVEHAESLATTYDLSPLDALHVAAAIRGRAHELVTLEKATKPMCRVKELSVISIYQE
ncbi:MAG: type II toxin-antitoxin system VapC family toxin [Candidatus Competibacteraceae bacterium]|mgnify:CR=1 FL=1|nr:type II toxin-antitoxin system VapC family toxin [Candidatus Competibacteraceae bacterium]HRY15399.1 type II toxin-antitoxin system VapC family toxin [Candidatus Competibacteraceae bacterium]